VLEDSSPLPPPDEQVLSDDQRAHLSWTLARGQQGCAGVAVIQKEGPLEQAVPWLVTHNREQEAARRLRACRQPTFESGPSRCGPAHGSTLPVEIAKLARTAAIALMNLGDRRAEALVRKAVLGE
jgi:hypothetical protein